MEPKVILRKPTLTFIVIEIEGMDKWYGTDFNIRKTLQH
jgi:hypothetical protein